MMDYCNILLLRPLLLTHPLPRLGDLGEDILSREISRADDTRANEERVSIPPQPTTRSCEHVFCL